MSPKTIELQVTGFKSSKPILALGTRQKYLLNLVLTTAITTAYDQINLKRLIIDRLFALIKV